jgi:hypothetical protein
MAKRTRSQRSRDVRPSEKAWWHDEAGAGKGRVVRPFFGLSDADERAIEQEVDLALTVNLGKSEGNYQ